MKQEGPNQSCVPSTFLGVLPTYTVIFGIQSAEDGTHPVSTDKASRAFVPHMLYLPTYSSARASSSDLEHERGSCLFQLPRGWQCACATCR